MQRLGWFTWPLLLHQVASGEVDLAIGGDQGGSVRLPSCWCGIVGMKPSYGLVPYTGAMSIEPCIDHLGPMARTVNDCALFLEVKSSRFYRELNSSLTRIRRKETVDIARDLAGLWGFGEYRGSTSKWMIKQSCLQFCDLFQKINSKHYKYALRVYRPLLWAVQY